MCKTKNSIQHKYDAFSLNKKIIIHISQQSGVAGILAAILRHSQFRQKISNCLTFERVDPLLSVIQYLAAEQH